MVDDRHSGDPASDEALVLRYGAGEPSAARVLTQRLAPGIHRLAARMLGDTAEAEDVTQETMLRLWRAAPGWRSGAARVSTWTYRVAANLAIDRLRRRRTAPLAEADEVPDGQPGVEAALIAADRAEALQTALLALPERQRQAVILRHLEGLANPEIAEIMELSVEAVESLSARGRRALQALLVDRRAALGYEEG